MSKFHALEVSDIRAEADDCVSVAFNVPEALQADFKYTQGQHISLKAMLDGEDVRRSYSICVSVADDELRVAVRHVDGGRMSGYINNELKVGDKLEVFPPAGHFYVELDASSTRTYVAFAGGSGITPIMSIIKTTLESEPDSKFLLFYANRTPNSTVFRQALSRMKNKFMQRFSFFHFLSDELQEFEFFNGFITADKVKEILKTIVPDGRADHYFICGPGTMIDDISGALKDSGVDGDNIHFELFSTDEKAEVNKPTDKKSSKKPSDCHITITLDGVEKSFDYVPSDGSVLDAAAKTGADVPFSCKGGVCCTCRAKLLEGEVEMAVNYGLEPDEVAAGYVLTCQSTPLTKKLVLNYDK